MKRLATYNLSFGSYIRSIVFLVILITSFVTPAHAAVDFSLVVKSKTTTGVVITIKNDVQSSVNNEGNYRDMVEFVTSIIRDSDGISVGNSTIRSAGKEQKDVSFGGLAQNTAYTAQIKAQNITTQEVSNKSISFKTTGSAATGGTTTLLPVQFVESLTSTGQNTITVTVRNKSTKEFTVTIAGKETVTGAALDAKKVILAGGADGKAVFSQITTGTYDLVMTGKQTGSSSTYQSVLYSGLKVTALATTNTGTTGTTTTGATQDASGTTPVKGGDGTCKDGKDNSNPLDGKADYYGVDTDNNGKIDLEPDPSCISPESTEGSDLPAGELLSCYNYCTFSDILKTINKFITFLITVLFVPTIVLLCMFAGFKYLTAQGNPKKVADLKKMLLNIIVGMLLILCSWLIVKVILRILVKDSDSALQFLE